MWDPLFKHFYRFAHFFRMRHVLRCKKCVPLSLLNQELCLTFRIGLVWKQITKRCTGERITDIMLSIAIPANHIFIEFILAHKPVILNHKMYSFSLSTRITFFNFDFEDKLIFSSFHF